jgi:predicted nucleotidyltransferase
MLSPILTRDQESVRQIVLDALQGYRAKVWLFGSQATCTARRHSDIDVVILPLEPLPRLTFFNIRDALEESDVIRTVDVVDLSETDELFRQRVEKEGIRYAAIEAQDVTKMNDASSYLDRVNELLPQINAEVNRLNQ